MSTVLKRDGITGKVLEKHHAANQTEGLDMATELLSIHLVEFDQIGSIKKKNSQLFTIKHIDGTYAPIEVLVKN